MGLSTLAGGSLTDDGSSREMVEVEGGSESAEGGKLPLSPLFCGSGDCDGVGSASVDVSSTGESVVDVTAGEDVTSEEKIVVDVVENEVVNDESDSVVDVVEKVESSVEVVADEVELKSLIRDTESEAESVLDVVVTVLLSEVEVAMEEEGEVEIKEEVVGDAWDTESVVVGVTLELLSTGVVDGASVEIASEAVVAPS